MEKTRQQKIWRMCAWCELGKLQEIAHQNEEHMQEDLLTVCQYGDISKIRYFLKPGVVITKEMFAKASLNEHHSTDITMILQIAMRLSGQS